MRELKRELWPYQVRVELPESNDYYDSDDDMESWLRQRIGDFKVQWNVVYGMNHNVFYFREPADATMFALRWQ
jgi:hypothetical protein